MDSALKVKNVVVDKDDEVSVRVLLQWIHTITEKEIKDLIQLRSGAIYCKVLHLLYPKWVPLENVHFRSLGIYDERNFDILKNSLIELDVNLNIFDFNFEVRRGNLEFTRWLFKFYKVNSANEEMKNVFTSSTADAMVTPKARSSKTTKRSPKKISKELPKDEDLPTLFKRIFSDMVLILNIAGHVSVDQLRSFYRATYEAAAKEDPEVEKKLSSNPDSVAWELQFLLHNIEQLVKRSVELFCMLQYKVDKK